MEQGAKGKARVATKKPAGTSEAKGTGETQLPARAGTVPVCLTHKSLLRLLKTPERMWVLQRCSTSYSPLALFKQEDFLKHPAKGEKSRQKGLRRGGLAGPRGRERPRGCGAAWQPAQPRYRQPNNNARRREHARRWESQSLP